MTLPWSTHNDQNGNDMGVKMVAPCQLSGDFAITAHYKLITWPLNSEAWVGIGAGPDNVSRVSFRSGSDNNYATYLAGAVTRAATADKAGSVRLARAGGTITGYYQDATGQWITIASGSAPNEPMTYDLQLLTDAGFGQRDVVVAVDSVSVTGTKVNCS
jgi:hypothetical protein